MNSEFVITLLLALIGQGATAAGIYAAIRADLREYKIRIDHLKEWQDKHKCN